MNNINMQNHAKLCLKFFMSLLSVLIVLSYFVFQSAQASSTAKNRNDVYKILNNLKAELAMADLAVWINAKTPSPSVYIGDRIYFTIKSSEPAFYTLIHVDSKGNTLLVNPASTITGNRGTDYMVYPPLVSGCTAFELDKRCFAEEHPFIQSEPIGQDAVFLIASKRPIPLEKLGMKKSEEYKFVGNEIPNIENLIQQINSQTHNNPISVVKYTYSVESYNTQYSTRAIGRKVKRVAEGIDESIVFNNINFAFDSSELTIPSRVELDGLGSALVKMQEQLGEIPVVKLIGHTDSIGSETYNATLSKQRAEASKQYLVSEHGLPVGAIRTIWKGESEPLGPNDTQSGRATNRRVVLRIP